MRRLTEEQKERASREPACRIPWAVAARACRGRPAEHDEYLRAACMAYVACAGRFDPARHAKGEDGWPGYATHWTRLMASSLYAKGKATAAALSLDAPIPGGGGASWAADTLTAPDRVCPVEAADLWRLAMLFVAPGRPRKSVVAWLSGATLTEVGAMSGASRQSASAMVSHWLRKIRRRVQGATP